MYGRYLFNLGTILIGLSSPSEAGVPIHLHSYEGARFSVSSGSHLELVSKGEEGEYLLNEDLFSRERSGVPITYVPIWVTSTTSSGHSHVVQLDVPIHGGREIDYYFPKWLCTPTGRDPNLRFAAYRCGYPPHWCYRRLPGSDEGRIVERKIADAPFPYVETCRRPNEESPEHCVRERAEPSVPHRAAPPVPSFAPQSH